MYGAISVSKDSPLLGTFVVKGIPENRKSVVDRHWRTFVATLSATLGSLTLGATIAYTSPAVPDLNSHPNRFHLSPLEVSWVASIISLGGVLGEPIGGMSVDRYGRRMTLILVTLPFLLAWVLVGVAPNVYCMYVGRFMTGLCCGVIDVAVPIYIAEISDKDVRGFMGSCHELATNTGYLFAFALGIVLSWNWLAMACAALPFFMLLMLISFAPESPRWLMMHGHQQECIDALTWLRGSDSADVVLEVTAIKETLEAAGSDTQMHWKELGHANILRPLLIVASLMLCQQLSGYGAIPEYLVAILQSAGAAGNAFVQTAIVGVFGVVANLLSALMVDRIGRRIMLIVSALVMTVSMAAMATFFLVWQQGYFLGPLPMVAMTAYNFGVALGYGPIPFYLASELFPLRARGLGAGISISAVWIFMFATSFAFPHLIGWFGEAAIYSALTVTTFGGVLVAWCFVPETKGKSLEEIEGRFQK